MLDWIFRDEEDNQVDFVDLLKSQQVRVEQEPITWNFGNNANIEHKCSFLFIRNITADILSAMLSSIGIKYGKSDVFLHGFNSFPSGIQLARYYNGTISLELASYFLNGLRLDGSSGGGILGTACLTDYDSWYGNVIRDYSFGNVVVVVNIPHSYRELNFGAIDRYSQFCGEPIVKKCSGLNLRLPHLVPFDNLDLDHVPKELIVGAYVRDVQDTIEKKGTFVFNPYYYAFESQKNPQVDGRELTNYESLLITVQNAPGYDKLRKCATFEG